jgi:hypothetical protein
MRTPLRPVVRMVSEDLLYLNVWRGTQVARGRGLQNLWTPQGKGCKSLIILSGSTGFSCSFERCSSDFGSKWPLGAFFVERLTSNKEGKNSKCFAERRLQALSPEISPPVVP